MIRSIGLHTYEIDDAEAAVAEINAELEGFSLMENTVGVIMCDPDYLDSGVYTAVCEALPFPVAGVTTTTQAVNGEVDILILTVLVMTSDDVFFSVGVTEEIAVDNDALNPTRASFEEAVKALPSEPKLILTFPPQIEGNAGDTYVEALGELCPGVPLFGTSAINDTVDAEHFFTLFNGDTSRNRMAFILIAGNIKPRFLVSVINDRNKTQFSGEITKSKDNIVQEINGIPAYDYFESIGVVKDGKLDEGFQFIPMLTEFKKRDDYDGVPTVRVIVYVDKDGDAVCRGNMYQNSIFTITTPAMDEVLQSSTEFIDKIVAMPDRQATLIFSCIIRRMTLGTTPLTEAEMVDGKLGGGSPYMFAYAGGEICPTSIRDGKAVNRYHNYSIIACIL
ncbi:MAG: FIST C-terminal domain-containing protein [Clostridiales Family XIII bacterium]|jgi:hypothetical protein|nr:FIST C-terminal domain-containing protein [Clostridiales Family XIII bacterium]